MEFVLFFVLALVVVLLVVLGLVIYGRLAVRNQRKALVEMRRNGLAFLCRPTLGLRSVAGFVLSVDPYAVSLWKVGAGRTTRQRTFPSAGARVGPAMVKINVARTSSGLAITSASGERVDAVLYPDPTMGYSTPADGAVFDGMYAQIGEYLTRVTGRR